jgi:hypothetical protein
MSELFSRVKLHWDTPTNLDVVRQVVSVRIHDQRESRELEVELPYDQNYFEIVTRTPSKVEYLVRVYNSSGEFETSELFVRRIGRSIKPNPATNLAADIIANDVPDSTKLTGTNFEPGRVKQYPARGGAKYAAGTERGNV